MFGSWPPTDFPNLKQSDFEITSPSEPSYNCLGWAAGEEEWWEPDPDGNYYWPDAAPREYTVPAFLAAYESIGYKICDAPEPEDGFEKIVLYQSDEDYPPHVARQLTPGNWTSKLGVYEDIKHMSLECLNGELYGHPAYYLKRPVGRRHP
jgi:hypothetical protein